MSLSTGPENTSHSEGPTALGQTKANICIAGAGVAGAALAAFLGKSGLRVTVIEKDLSEPDRIVGELLQPGGVHQLMKIGLEEAISEIDAQPIVGYSLFLNNENFKVTYPLLNNERVSGRGFRNGKFLTALRNILYSNPNITVIEGKVTQLLKNDDSVSGLAYLSNSEDEAKHVSADLTVISDGCMSTLRDGLVNSEKIISSYFIGLKLKDVALPYPEHGHVIMADPSPFLIYPIGFNEHRVLVDHPGTKAPRPGKQMEEYLKNKILPQVPETLKASFEEAIKESNPQVMPNHRMPAKPISISGLVLLGDSLNMRHPLTGGGMTVALNDVELLGRKIIELDDTEDMVKVSAAVSSFYKSRNKNDQSINILADALYGVMSHPLLKVACFDYLKRGPQYSEIPISLLGGISSDRTQLIKKFLAVARFGAWQALKPFPTPARIKKAMTILSDARKILQPLL